MSLLQGLGIVVLVVVAFYAVRWLRVAWSARASSDHPGHADMGWPDTRPRGRDGEPEAAPQDFSDDTAPAVLSIPFGLDDNELPPPRERGRRRAP